MAGRGRKRVQQWQLWHGGRKPRRANPAFLFTSGGGVPFLHSLRLGGGQGGGAPCQSLEWAVPTPGRLALRDTEDPKCQPRQSSASALKTPARNGRAHEGGKRAENTSQNMTTGYLTHAKLQGRYPFPCASVIAFSLWGSCSRVSVKIRTFSPFG